MSWLDIAYRKNIIENIGQSENKGRKEVSLIESEISNGNNKQYVEEYLLTQFAAKTVKEMPIISCLNLSRKIERNLASIYKKSPTREWSDVTDEQKKSIELIYADGRFNQKLLKANRNLVGQRQGTGYIVPKDGKLMMKILRPHHFDVVPSEHDPEEAAAYIISVMDRTYLQRFNRRENKQGTGYTGISSANVGNTDHKDNAIADYQDFQASTGIYIVWTKKYNFMMDGAGNVLDPISKAPMANVSEEDIFNIFYKQNIEFMPFFDFCLSEKDYEYWVRDGSSLTNFTIQFNSSFTDVANIVRMQGWSQAYLIADQENMPESVQVGPTKLLKLKQSFGGTRPEFGYASPNSDIPGSMQFLETFLYLFLSCEDIDPKTISTKGDSTVYNSALERYIAMIDKLEANEDHYDIFRGVENKIATIIKNYQAVLDSEQLEDKYITGNIDKSVFAVKYHSPGQPKSEKEALEVEQLKKEMRLTTRKKILMKIDNISSEQADALIDEIDQDLIAVNSDVQVGMRPDNSGKINQKENLEDKDDDGDNSEDSTKKE